MFAENVWAGILSTFTLEGFGFILIGTMWGVVAGALPGISASMGMALLLPFSIGLPPVNAFSLLVSSYVGAEFGGSIPAILLATPGTSAGAATILDGHTMHLNGYSGKALGYSLCAGTFGSLIGSIACISIMPALVKIALLFNAADFFSLSIFGLSAVVSMARGSFVKGFISVCFGLLLGTVGSDIMTGAQRFTFGIPALFGGLNSVPAVIGLVAGGNIVAQVMKQVMSKKIEKPQLTTANMSFITLKEMLATWKVALFSSIVGVVIGVMPGAGTTIASFIAYNESRRFSKDGDRYGQGVPDGIVAPEAANDSCVPAAFVPLLAFGIPGSTSAAIMLGAMIMHGIRPGPMFMVTAPNILYSFFLAIILSSISLFVVGRLLMKPFLYVTYVRTPHLYTSVISLIVIGMLSLHEGMLPLYLLLIFTVIGYLVRVAEFNAICVTLGFVLSKLIENNFRRALLLSRGDPTVFFTSPISLTLLILTALTIYFGMRGQTKEETE